MTDKISSNEGLELNDLLNSPSPSTGEIVGANVINGSETSLFSTMFGSAAAKKAFEYLMSHAGTYLFGAAFVLTAAKFFYQIYQFIKTRNKNVHKTGSFLWNSLQFLAVGTAIGGAILAATTFALATPVLFVSAMAIDTCINIGKLGWNTFQLAALRYKKDRLTKKDGEDDPLGKIKYDELKSKFVSRIKQSAIGSAIGSVVTLGAAAIFLFPHIAAGGVATFAATAVAIGGIKTTVAGILGTAATAAMVSPWLYMAGKGIKKGISLLADKIKNSFKKDVSEDTNHLLDNAPETKDKNEPLNKGLGKVIAYEIRSKGDLKDAIKHKMSFKAYSLESNYRPLIINHITKNVSDNINEDGPNLARKAMLKFIKNKIESLQTQMNKGREISFSLSRKIQKKQESTQSQKITALNKLNDFLKGIEVQDEHRSIINDIPGLVAYIKRAFPAIEQSWSRDESDTYEVFKAALEYAKRFPDYKNLIPQNRQDADAMNNVTIDIGTQNSSSPYVTP